MGLFRKLLRRAARSANRVIVEKALPRVKAEDLLPYKPNEADDRLVEVEAQSNGDMKDLYDYSRLPDATDEDFAPDVNDTVLILVARTGDAHILNMLLDIPGMDINAQNPSNETALLVAEKEGQTDTVLKLLQQQNIDVNLKDKNNGTVLTYAADRNDTEVVSLLLQRHPVDVNSRTTANDTALVLAARKGHVTIVKSLLQHFDIDVNAKNEIGETALIGSARAGFTEAVAALLAHPHIQPNAYTVDYHDTALMWTARNNHTSAFLHLLAHPSVDPTLVNKDGKTALDLAVSEELALILKVYNKRSGSATESRKSLSTDPLSLDKNRRAHAKATHPPDKVVLVESAPATGYEKWRGQLPSPLQTLLAPVSDVYLSHAVTAVACFVLFYLVQRVFGWKKPKPKSTTDASTYIDVGPVVLHMGTESDGDFTFETQALTHAFPKQDDRMLYSDPNAPRKGPTQDRVLATPPEQSDATALYRAVRNGHTEMVSVLLGQPDIDVNAENKGRTLLHAAAERGHADVVSLLMSSPLIDVNARTMNGETALMLAVRPKYHTYEKEKAARSVERLHTTGDRTALEVDGPRERRRQTKEQAVQRSSIEKVGRLPDSDSDTDTDKAAPTADADAPEEKERIMAVARTLLSHPTTEVNAHDKIGKTALILAAENGLTAIVELLLSLPGIEVNARTDRGETALVLAAHEGHAAIVKALLSHPTIDVNIYSTHGESALTYAAWHGHESIVDMLLAHPSIDVNADNKSGAIALIRAVQLDYLTIAHKLLAYPGIDVNGRNEFGRLALTVAAKRSHTDIVKKLLAHPSIDINARNEDGKPALLLAAERGHAAVIEALLSHPNIDVNACGPTGESALVVAAQQGFQTIVKAIRAHPSQSGWHSDKMSESLPVRSHRNVKVNTSDKYTPATERVQQNQGGRPNMIELSLPRSDGGVNVPEGRDRDSTSPGGTERCCPFCPEISLIAIRNRHIDCLRLGLDVCGPHPDACTRACEFNLVDFLQVLRVYRSPWCEKTTSAAASRGHVEALQFAMENRCPYDFEDIARCAARVGSLPALSYLVEQQGAYMHVDGSTFGAAFERAHLDCVMYLIDASCPFNAYTFGGEDLWTQYRTYREQDVDYDARLASCIQLAADRGWGQDDNLVEFILAHSHDFPHCVAILENEGWI